MREDSNLEMPRRLPMDSMRWSLVKVIDGCPLGERRGFDSNRASRLACVMEVYHWR
jgi:hypothetical protein